MRRRPFLAMAAGAAAQGAPRPLSAQPARHNRSLSASGGVDTLLVLAVDVSRSIVEEEAKLQREGYRAAMLDADILRAIRSGETGAIGLAYVEWADFDRQRLTLPWARIARADDAAAWVQALGRAPIAAPAIYTSISGAIDFSCRLLGEAPWPAARRVIDISGDGVHNDGDPVSNARDRALAAGITINGLPILGHGPAEPTDPYLEDHYRTNVVGGEGAFVMAAVDFAAFGRTVRRKLIKEIAVRLPGHGGDGSRGRG